jgi:hypothetical protein
MKNILCILLLIATLPAYAQDLSAEIQKEFMHYSELVKAKDFDKVLEYTHPALFETYPKDQVKAGLEQVFNNPQIEIELGEPVLSEIANAKQIENKYYVRFKSFQVTKMKFGFIEEQTGTDKENTINTLKQNLAAQFGEGNISYDTQTGFFVVNATTKMLAVSDDKKAWKFVDIGNAQFKSIVEKFIPAEFFN